MENIRLISILPVQGAAAVSQPPLISQGGTSQPGVSVNLPSGSILSGFIVNRDAGGNPVLRTDKGDVTFSSDFFLKIGSEVVIRIETRVGNTSAHIVTVNGQPPEVAVTQSGFAQSPEVIVSDALGGKTPAQAQTTSTREAALVTPDETAPQQTVNLKGTLITPAAGKTPQDITLPASTQFNFKVVSLTTPEGASAPLSIAAPQPASTPTLYAAYARFADASKAQTQPTPAAAQSAEAAETPETPLPTVKQFVSELFKPVTAPQASVTAPTAVTPQTPAPGTVVTATVIGNEPTGEAVLQTPYGTVRLQPGTVLPTGSKITFEINTTTLPAQALAANRTDATAPAPVEELAHQWQTLQQLSTLLADRAPGSPTLISGFEILAAGHAPWLPRADGLPPQPGFSPQAISAGLLLFISALRGGNFRNWFGADNIKWLEGQGHDALLRKAEGEFLSVARQFTEPTPPHWQTLLFPVAVAGDWQQVRMFIKRDRRQPGGNRPRTTGGDDTRFVIEADLSQLGSIQMDGFVRKQEQGTEFDLFIRSFRPLSEDVQQDILSIYSNTGELTGYTGNLLFQTVKEFPVNPLEEVMAHRASDVVA